jgi:RimJ/RimL family protein N-acetyltransferase
LRLTTTRLTLSRLDELAIDAWIAGDANALRRLTGAVFREPVDAPPLLGEDLPRTRAMVAAGTAPLGPLWLFVLAETAEPVGAGGFGPWPEQGTVCLGYSVWPAHQGRGYASEAVRALCSWALRQPQVNSIVATIPPGHSKSVRVAEAAGLRRVGTAVDPDAGPVDVFRLDR